MESLIKTLEGFGIKGLHSIAILFLGGLLGLALTFPELALGILSFLFVSAPAWLPLLLAIILWHLRLWSLRARFIASQEMILLEVKVPRDIEKSPRAMELAFAGLHIGMGEGTFIDLFIYGKVRPWYSFEIVSEGGRIHFYVWTRKFLKDIVEAQIYAQYPEVEIFVVPDYAKQFPYNTTQYNLWGCDFKLGQKDVYPIKTYIDYELDKDPKEEFKVDPLAHLFEHLSTLKPGERIWIQVLIRTNKDLIPKVDPKTKKVSWFEKEDRWKTEAKQEIQKIRDASVIEYDVGEGKKARGFPNPTPSDIERIKAIGRSLDKQAFDTGIRAIYIAEKDAFRAPSFVGMTGIFKQFSSAHLNSLVPTGGMTVFNFPWQKLGGAEDKARKKLFDAYRRRSWFHPPHKKQHFVMTTEELATIFHFPSRAIRAPGLERIPATKSEAPPNLPV